MSNVFPSNNDEKLPVEQLKQIIISVLPILRRYAFSLTANPADADDLLQSLIERLLKTSIPAEATPLAWMIKVCRNMWIDEIRKRQVQQQYAHTQMIEGDALKNLENVVNDELQATLLNQAISKLPEPQRDVLTIIVSSGMSYADAADILNVPIGTVMSRVSRARQALRDMLMSDQGECNATTK